MYFSRARTLRHIHEVLVFPYVSVLRQEPMRESEVDSRFHWVGLFFTPSCRIAFKTLLSETAEKMISLSVCLSVCLSILSISDTICPNLIQFLHLPFTLKVFSYRFCLCLSVYVRLSVWLSKYIFCLSISDALSLTLFLSSLLLKHQSAHDQSAHDTFGFKLE